MKIKLKKGSKLKIAGATESYVPAAKVIPVLAAICPDDFPGFTPKPAVSAGEAVCVGSPLLSDKKHPEVKLVSPIAGTVREIVRGERRRILRVEIEVNPDGGASLGFPKATDAASLRRLLANSGLLAMMRQRPYDIVPNPDDTVRDIFVTAIASAPLEAPVAAPAGQDLESARAAVKALASLTEGKVYISHAEGTDFPDIEGAETIEVAGVHPSGNAGVQIAAIKPVNKGEIVWTLTWDVLLRIGRLLLTGNVDCLTDVVIAGPEVEKPCVVTTEFGAAIAPLVEGRLKDDGLHKRIISGNVLTGTATGDGADAFLRAPYRQITVIAEGDDKDEFMGWASVAPSKMSESRALPFRWLTKAFSPDARLNGGRRAIIMSGEYDRMIPMDILPEYLIKAIIARDIEQMEALGIYEVAPEDFALAEYADTSKLPLQQIVRDGLDYLRKELE